jgi:hypothetical protein
MPGDRLSQRQCHRPSSKATGSTPVATNTARYTRVTPQSVVRRGRAERVDHTVFDLHWQHTEPEYTLCLAVAD